MTQEPEPRRSGDIRAELQNWLFARLPQAILETLSEDQKQALHRAVTDPHAGPPVNIRLTLPFFGRRYYLTVLSGQEKRGRDRRRFERTRYPLRTLANIFFVIGAAVAFYALALMALALLSAVVEV